MTAEEHGEVNVKGVAAEDIKLNGAEDSDTEGEEVEEPGASKKKSKKKKKPKKKKVRA